MINDSMANDYYEHLKANGGYDDIDDFLKIYPNNEYVIYDSVFDYYNKNRVPFFSIKDDEYLKYICCNNELYVKEEIYVE